ncbi:hypothetical protein FBU30_004902 [Linnemannia zychae]|nr:hypothetical protein FBU30_004902 [Linnemannia zychae]
MENSVQAKRERLRKRVEKLQRGEESDSDEDQQGTAGGSGGHGSGHGGNGEDDKGHDEDEEAWETEISEDEEEKYSDFDAVGSNNGDENDYSEYDIDPTDPDSIFFNALTDLSGSEEDGDDEEEDSEDLDDMENDDDEDDDEDMDEGPEILDDDKKIEELSPQTRAVYKPIYLEDDVMSEFSGDEKYAPKEFISGKDGEGDQDMVDFSVYEESNEEDPEYYKLTTKIRELMLNLKKGRAERERKLALAGYQQEHNPHTYSEDSPMAPNRSSLVSSESVSHDRNTGDPAPYLHRLLVRGYGHPREVEHSPAISNHFQCANSMTISPSTMGLWDDIFTIHLHSIMRCGVLERNTPANYERRTLANMALEYPWADAVAQKAQKAVLRPYAKKLRTVRATKYLDLYSYRFDQLPESEEYVRLDDQDDPLCLTHRYGYLAHGAVDGAVVVYCTQCKDEPHQIRNSYLADESDEVMLNSLQIVRWDRYHHNRTSLDGQSSSDVDCPIEDYDDKDGFPSSKSGQFDHFLIMAGNEGGLFIAGLPDHPNPQKNHKQHGHNNMPKHTFKYRDHHTWIRTGFQGAALNDAKVSPNGRWIAVVGDSAKVWIIEVTHVPETEEERVKREEKEELMDIEELETDSEYNTDDSMDTMESENLASNKPKDCKDSGKVSLDKGEVDPTSEMKEAMGSKGSRGAKRSRGSEDSPSDEDDQGNCRAKNSKPTPTPRLLHRFGQPQELLVPHKVLFTEKHKKNRQPLGPDGVTGSGSQAFSASKVSFQYVSWNATSTKFAHSSDTASRVVVWSMPSKEIVCCVDTGGPSYSIDFHPKLENLFAVANWYGFVHVIDITGSCIGDKDLVVSDKRYNGQAENGGPSLAGCEGPHYEEKHDILMLSFRGQNDMRLRILDAIRGLGWSTDGRYLYVSTLRRVLQYEIADQNQRIPSLFQLCARKVKQWKEREMHRVYTKEVESSIKQSFGPIQKQWELVPYAIKRKIWGDHFLMRSHSG